ncbi:MAG: glucose-6-phosphate dehydrogenase [Anaerolineae bacterium]|nr:glucose-6-phosphate dehydrogenase [Anaerolineae bacterium]
MSATIVIFGASGDLTQRKLIPALFNLCRKRRLPSHVRIVGVARTKHTDQSFLGILREGALKFSGGGWDEDDWTHFARRVHYFPGDASRSEDMGALKNYLAEMENGDANRLYYLSTAPNLYIPITANLGAHGMAAEAEGWRRVIIEKPIGYDLKTALELNDSVHRSFSEPQVYRIDHYLGKETAQNIMFLRFANTIFEPVWNRNYVEYVQVTVAESVDVGTRGDYYDHAGVLRDMFQNHLLQLLALVAMEPPPSFDADKVRNETVKVLNSIRPVPLQDTVRAQYRGYRETPGVAPDSQTPTYAALKLHVDNWRWQGVPFYLRSGKALSRKDSEIVIRFRRPPHLMFELPPGGEFEPNTLSICIQPDEGIHLKFEAKIPDSLRETRSVDMEFHYRDSFKESIIPEAYERLLMDALNGDASLFVRSDGVEVSWRLIDPILRGWESPEAPPLALYERGEWGPLEADELLARDGHKWRHGCGEHE